MEKKDITHKRIVVITDTSLTDKATGMAQTLGNLFDEYPANNLLLCTPVHSSGKFKTIRSIAYKGSFFNSKFSRKLLSPKLQLYFFKAIKVPLIRKKILRFKPDIIVISNLAFESSLITMTLLKKYKLPLCVYLMDHISKEDKNAFDKLFYPLMQMATKHIFISKYMADMYLAQYSFIQDHIIIHNPVKKLEIAAFPKFNLDSNEISFAYAGSLWPMHIDAIISFAKAILKLRSAGYHVKFVIYTTSNFYKLNAVIFEQFGITYAGFYRFDHLKSHLLQHNCLLVASSFEERFYELSAYSVQTKVTDYLACGIPIIAIGPEYSACNKFIKENDCGFIINCNDEAFIASRLIAYLKKDRDSILEQSEKGLKLIRDHYEKSFVQQKLYSFLSSNN